MQKQSLQIQKQPKKIQQKLFFPMAKKPLVVNVKVKFLRQSGYKDFQQWSQNPNNVYIGRNMTQYIPGAKASKWRNPFKVEENGRDQCIKQNQQLMKDLKQLKGKTLGCWCKPDACHGDVLVELLEKYSENSQNQ